MMKHLTNRLLFFTLGAAVLLASGCDILEKPYKKGIKFSASSAGGVATKAYFGQDVGSYETIHWQDGDRVRIAARYARSGNGDFAFNGASYYDYTVGNITMEGHYSKGKLMETNSGLFWNPDLKKTDDEFWSIYPADEARTLVGGTEYDGAFSSSISSVTSAEGLPPLMVAHSVPTSNTNGATVTLNYAPAFTSFLIVLWNDTGKSFTLDNFSITAPNSAPALAGDYTGTISGTGEDVTVSNVLVSNAIREVSSAALPTIVPSMSHDSFFIFCLPQDLRDVVLHCTYTPQGGAQKTKSMNLSGYTFAACKQHRLYLTLDKNGEVNMEISLGGAQLLLMTLKNNSSKVISGIKAYYNVGAGPAYLYPNGMKCSEMIQSILYDKISTNGDAYIKEHFAEADKIFTGSESFSFTSEELEILKTAVLPLITETGTIGQEDYSKVTSDIVSSDFSWLPNLERINHLETRQDINPRPSLEVGDLPSLTYIELNQYTYVTASDCGGDAGLTLNMSNANNSEGEIVIKDLKFNDVFNIGNQHPRGPVTFDNVSGLSQVSLGNATEVTMKDCPDLQSVTVNTGGSLTSFTVENCPQFTTFTIWNAGSSFKSITLRDTPKFMSGTAGNNLTDFLVTLQNCSGNVWGTPYIQLDNTQIGNVSVSKDATSSHVEVRANGGVK